jgi:hypothetical protein
VSLPHHLCLVLRRGTAFLALLVASASSQAAGLSGHWTGAVLVPGTPLPIVLDFDHDGEWKGWVTLPGHGVSAVPLQKLVFTNETLQADLSGALPSGGPKEPSRVVLRLAGSRLTGHLEQGGHRAVVTLERVGEAQVATARQNTPIDAKLAGVWQGAYVLGGQSREVTLTMKAGPPSAESADLTVVGRRTTHIALDQVQQLRGGISLGSSEMGVSIDVHRRDSDDALEGTFQQGPYDAPLSLRRVKVGT